MAVFLDTLAQEIDAALDRNDTSELRQLLESIQTFDRTSLSSKCNASLDFYTANLYAGLRYDATEIQKWAWAQPYIAKEIYHLRLALNRIFEEPNKESATDLKFRILTNLANVLNHVGRFVEAIELWDQTIAEYSKFGMAVGNRAIALFWYAKYLDDTTIKIHFLKESLTGFTLASSIGVEEHAKDEMRRWHDHISSMANWDSIQLDLPEFRNGKSKTEQKYRRWCVNNRLALNPINDISQDASSYQDTLMLPAITLPEGERNAELPKPYAIFNQLKQEYISARYLIFEAIQDQNSPLHFADKGVVLYDALDYRYYRLWIEKLKMAFLAAHAIFDKIAYLINEYWKLGLKVRSVNFNSIWYTESQPKLGISKKFETSQNWPLRGLYWLSKDFYTKSNSDLIVDPEAKILHEIRNHIAHKYLRVHDHILYSAENERVQLGHDLSYPVSELELQNQSIKLLKLVRSALIYLTAAVAHEESVKKLSSKKGFIATMPITAVSDKHRL